MTVYSKYLYKVQAWKCGDKSSSHYNPLIREESSETESRSEEADLHSRTSEKGQARRQQWRTSHHHHHNHRRVWLTTDSGGSHGNLPAGARSYGRQDSR